MQRRLFWPALISSVLLLVLVVVWTQRTPIADNLISRELVKRDVSARYDIAQIGMRTQRLENLVLGNRDNPDLTAHWVEVDISVLGLSPRVTAVRAGGVRLHGRIVDGKLQLGELDKFRDLESKAPFGLPDLRLSLDDARMQLDTPMGPVGLKLDGSGNLRSGFKGKLAAVMPQADFGGCKAREVTVYADLSVNARQPRFKGPVRAGRLDCPAASLALARPAAKLDILLNEALDHWRGKADLSVDTLASGGMRLAGIGGDVSFDGDARATKGRADLFTSAFSTPSVQTERAEFEGSYAAGKDKQDLYARLEGDARVRTLRMRGGNPVAKLRQASLGTPLEPLAAKFVDAIDAAGRANDARVAFALSQRGGAGQLRVTDMAFRSRSGARADLSEGSHLAWSWPRGAIALDGRMRVEGGGLPEAAIRLKREQKDGALSGQIFMQDYTAGTARLALEPVRFVASGRGGSRFTTLLRLDGPLPGGGLKGLTLPIDGRLGSDGVVRINAGCSPVGFTSVKYQSLGLEHGQLRLCPTHGGAMLAAGPGGGGFGAEARAPRLKGHIGESPLALAADSFRFGAPDEGFSAGGLKIALGAADALTVLDVTRLTGRFDAGGMAGELEGGAGRIGNVPLLMSDAAGKWRFAKGRLVIDGGMRIADATAPGRFHPLLSKDFSLTLQDNRIAANGTLVEPRTGARVATARIAHDLSNGVGKADLLVDDLRFDGALQPEDVTRLALGVIANVKGAVSGAGQIRWNRNGVTSDGRFRTQDMSLAAAFGPVSGLSGEIYFSDLLGLETPPGQEMRITSINPGIEATQGVIRYRLLPGQRAQIEGGKWPFAGGELTLEPTVLDFSAEKPRYLTFRIIGLQAGDFINELELENISATGTFDGLLPMIFDESGGRIVGGVLVARQLGLPPLYVSSVKELRVQCDPVREGGTLAYVGDVSNADLGMFGKLAFDALKSLRYKCLTILMDGNLDGEIVTQVSFNGVNQDPGGTKKSGMFSKFIGLPFIFNIRIEAPFRGLLNTAISFTDPTNVIRSHLGDGYQPVIENRLAVQPGESDTMPIGDK